MSAPAHDNDPKRIYEVVSPTGKVVKKCWAYTQDNFKQLIADNLIWWGNDGNAMPKRKRFLAEKQGLTPRSWIDHILTQDGKKDLQNLEMDNLFDYPKPVKLVKHLLSIATESHENAIVLDFFAGSGTTAQAVMALNEADGGNRSFILVQLPEPTQAHSEAHRAGYSNIAQLTRARIDKVIEQINQTKARNTDKKRQNSLNCRYFTLVPSCFKLWRTDITDKTDLAKQLADLRQSEKSDSLPENMLLELCLKNGLGLHLSYQLQDGFYKVCKPNTNYQTNHSNSPLWFCAEPYGIHMNELIIAQKPQKMVFLNSCFECDNDLCQLKVCAQEQNIELFIL